MSTRIEREKETVSAMIRIFCRVEHGYTNEICEECSQLEAYAHHRVEHCPFGSDKKVCGQCLRPCYHKNYRTRIQYVMRRSGPMMFFTHPYLTLIHFIDRFRFRHRNTNS